MTKHAVQKSWALITVTYNSASKLKEFWSHSEIPQDVEWVVVDNNSRDDTVAVAESLGAKVFKLPNNLGFSEANNVGFVNTSSRYVGFVNPDVRVDFSTLHLLEEAIDSTEGLVAPQLVNLDNSLQPNGRGNPYLTNKIMNRISPDRMENTYRLYAHASELKEVVWVIGAVVTGKRETFEKLHAWDSHFFLYYEDSDLGIRAKRIGIQSYVMGDVKWVHGWARETTSFRWAPWKREIASMMKFYTRYPALLFPVPGTEKS